EFLANSFGDGDAGLVTVETSKLFISEGAGIFASTSGAGQAGTMNINARESIDIIGTTPDGRFKSGILTNSFSEAQGAAGNLRIETGRLTIRDGAGVGAATFGEADGGTVTVIAGDLVEVLGTSADGKELSNFVTLSQGTGAAGDIEVITKRLVVRDGGVLSTATMQAGRAGRLAIRASDSVELIGTSADGQFPSGLRSDASSSSSTSSFLPPPRTDVLGEAGDLTIETGKLIISNGAQVTVSGEGAGAAGNITVEADLIRLEDGSQINATTSSQAGGNINLTTQDLQLRRSSQINTNADNTDGGNINIDTNTLVALENSDITANARQGRGGRVSISAQGIFGTEFREEETEESDITATSELGPEFIGSVEIKNPEVDPSRGLMKLPIEVVDPTKLIAIGCAAEVNNRFVVTGRGGLPPDPTQMLNQTAVWIDWRSADLAVNQQQLNDRSPVSYSPPTTQPIIEAQGWVINANGQVELVADPNRGKVHGSWFVPASCGYRQG
ncbi:MAG: S-layer family protein, partial [Coleofasciculaceae cyanobacterium]